MANKKPTNVLLSAGTVLEDRAGVLIGTLSATDPNLGDSFTFTTADARFMIIGDQLWFRPAVSVNFETGATKQLLVTATDVGGLSITRAVAFAVQDVNEAPTAITLSAKTVATAAAGAVIGTLKAVDPDAGDSVSYAVSDERFEIVAGTLKLKDGVALNYDLTNSVPVMVTATDSGGLSTNQLFTIGVTGVVVNEVQTVVGAVGGPGADGGAGVSDAAPGAPGALADANWTGALPGTGVADHMTLALHAFGSTGGDGGTGAPDSSDVRADGGAGGDGGEGGQATALLHDATLSLGGGGVRGDVIGLVVAAQGGLGGDGGIGSDVSTIATQGDGGRGGQGGNGGIGTASIRDVVLSAAGPLSLEVDVDAMGGDGGSGAMGGMGGANRGTGGHGGNEGDAGNARAEVVRMTVSSTGKSVLAFSVVAHGGDEVTAGTTLGTGGGGAKTGADGTAGNGGDGTAILSDSSILLGAGADSVLLQLGATGGRGVTDGLASVELHDNDVVLGGGNDLLKLGLAATTNPAPLETGPYHDLKVAGANFLFFNNTLSAGLGLDTLDLSLVHGAAARVDVAAGQLFIADSVGNAMSGFEVFVGTERGDLFLDGAGSQTYQGRAGADHYVFSAGHGIDRIVGWSTADVIELHGYGAARDSFADVMAHAADTVAGVRIVTPGVESILLVGVSMASLMADDFLFT